MCATNCQHPETGDFSCDSCVKNHDERWCHKGHIQTYNGQLTVDGVTTTTTLGGYSTDIVVNDRFVCPIPAFYHGENLKYASPILCAGVTVGTGMRRGNVKAGSKVGVNGIGGLGIYAVLIAQAFGAEVFALTRSQSKVADLMAMGCKDVILTTDAEQVGKYAHQLDFIIDTVAVDHNIDQLLGLLAQNGSFCMVGAQPEPLKIGPLALLMGGVQIFGSIIGSIQDTIDIINLCAEHKIIVPVEVIKPDYINEAYDRMYKSDVKYRFSIDIDAMRAE